MSPEHSVLIQWFSFVHNDGLDGVWGEAGARGRGEGEAGVWGRRKGRGSSLALQCLGRGVAVCECGERGEGQQ